MLTFGSNTMPTVLTERRPSLCRCYLYDICLFFRFTATSLLLATVALLPPFKLTPTYRLRGRLYRFVISLGRLTRRSFPRTRHPAYARLCKLERALSRRLFGTFELQLCQLFFQSSNLFLLLRQG